MKVSSMVRRFGCDSAVNIAAFLGDYFFVNLYRVDGFGLEWDFLADKEEKGLLVTDQEGVLSGAQLLKLVVLLGISAHQRSKVTIRYKL